MKIQARGLTLDELRAKVTEGYKSYLKSTTALHIALVSKKIEVEVRGLVTSPVAILCRPRRLWMKSWVQQMAYCQTLKLNSPSSKAARRKRSGEFRQILQYGDASLVPILHGGDTVFFQRSSAVNSQGLDTAHAKLRIMGK